jgi:hypothetical protein
MTYGIPNSILQPIFFGFGGLVFLALVWFIFIRKDLTFEKVYLRFAAKTGLVYTPPVSVGSMVRGTETSGLAGVLSGVQVSIASHYMANARAAGVNGSWTLRGLARAPGNVSFSLVVRPRRGEPMTEGTPIGDRAFDAAFLVASDNAQAARLLLDDSLRACVVTAPVGWSTFAVRYDRGAIEIEVGRFAFQDVELDHAFRLLLAACSARLA